MLSMQVRAAEAQAEEERSEVRSLRRQLQAQVEAGNGSRSEAGGAAFSERVADLEAALAAARQQVGLCTCMHDPSLLKGFEVRAPMLTWLLWCRLGTLRTLCSRLQRHRSEHLR